MLQLLKECPPSHLVDYMNYISTREGVEKVDRTTALLPATEKQKELIVDILSKIEDAGRMYEYCDYLQKPTRENASNFITQDVLIAGAVKDHFIDYKTVSEEIDALTNVRSLPFRLFTEKEDASNHCDCGTAKLTFDTFMN